MKAIYNNIVSPHFFVKYEPTNSAVSILVHTKHELCCHLRSKALYNVTTKASPGIVGTLCQQSRGSNYKISDIYRIQNLSDIVMEHKMCVPVSKRLIPVDYYQILA